MTEAELDGLRRDARVIALEILLDVQATAIRTLLGVLQTSERSPALKAIQDHVRAGLEASRLIPFRSTSPEMADLITAEFHSTLEVLAEQMLRKLEG